MTAKQLKQLLNNAVRESHYFEIGNAWTDIPITREDEDKDEWSVLTDIGAIRANSAVEALETALIELAKYTPEPKT